MTRYTAFPRLTRFNRECEFKVKRKIKLNGVEFKEGSIVDKTLLTTRRLRQLHDQRYLEQLPIPLTGPEVPTELNFVQLPTAAIIDWLAQRGKQPRPNSDRAKIINLATVVQEKEKAAKEKETGDALVPGDATKERVGEGVPRTAAEGHAPAKNSSRKRQLAR